jgi:hypothetical protein
MTFERPQSGNPHSLTVKQHVIPVVSIERFAGADGCVDVWLKKQGKGVRVTARDSLFYANRVWDQSAEQGLFRRIENAFQIFADGLLNESFSMVAPEQEATVSEFYALCYHRGLMKASPPPDVRQEALSTSESYNQNQAEILERNGYATTRPDGSLPGRHLAAIMSYFNIGHMRRFLSNYRWQVLRSTKAQFLVPDQFPDQAVMPIAPRVCLVAGAEGWVEIGENEVRRLNRLLVAASRNCYFAHELALCPK